MKVAGKIKAEPGWFYILGRSDGTVSFIEIEEWGLAITSNGIDLVPLDNVFKNDIRQKKNFISIFDPNIHTMDNNLKTSLSNEWAAKKRDLERNDRVYDYDLPGT
jgi:hypothetical protein